MGHNVPLCPNSLSSPDQYVYHPSYFIAVIYCQAIRLLSEFQFVTYLHLASNRFDIINARMKSYGVSKLLFVRDFKHPAYGE